MSDTEFHPPVQGKHVTIYCDDHHDRWDIDVFSGGVAGTSWSHIDMDHKYLRGVSNSQVGLQEDRVLTTDEPNVPTNVRIRYGFTCKGRVNGRVCKNGVAVTSEKLNPILDTLANAGVSEISLLMLGARLRRR